ncbi:hypothetical protein FJZ36_08270 [Candidatus Poribacteria bacterium]|nr:hypothetical protein [Candidatus Poribacteria bacterium]
MATTTVLPTDGSIVDRRFSYLPETNTVFDPPMPTYDSLDAWERRKAELRLHILVSSGLFPLPPKPPLNPRVTGKIEGDGFTIENVAFESYPGFFVTGNLYRPRGRLGPFPGVASPHGHARHGRLEHTDDFSIPGRGISLARQGFVTFCYDMVGYNDSLQIDHQFEGTREYLWGLSLLGLQLWNSIRVLDYLESLEDVDKSRIGCTGASGGGTQTFLLAAVDDRVKVPVPVNMISAHMQGGCLCENAPHLRLDATNVEIGAMAAPRPMLLISATGDWTKNTPSVEYPAIRRVYELYGAADHLAEVQIDAGHNYNLPSREAMYAWMNRWLRDERDATKLKEQPFDLPAPETMRVFPQGLPAGTPTRAQVVDSIIATAQAQLESLAPVTPELLERARTVLGATYQHVVNASVPSRVDVRSSSPNGNAERLVLSRPGAGDAIPGLYLHAKNPKGAAAVLVSPEGKASFVGDDGRPTGIASALLSRGVSVLAIDAFRTGESAGLDRKESRHFLTFNQTELANRIQDILTACAYAAAREQGIHLVGTGEAGIWALLARGLAPDILVTVADMAQWDNTDDASFEGSFYLPGIRRAGDIGTAGALAAPGRLALHNVHPSADLATIESAYRSAGASDALTIAGSAANAETVAGWIAG